MPFGCPYAKGTKEAAEYMRRLRSMRKCEGGPGNPSRAGKRSKKGSSAIGDFLKDMFKKVKDARQREGSEKTKFRQFADDMTGVTEIKEAKEKILEKLNKRQKYYLKRKIWRSEEENGIPRNVFDSLTGGAIPFWLVKLIGTMGVNAALTLWNKHKQKIQKEAMKY